jgi:nucleoside-diphosphate-sugar epimerase
MLEDLAGSRILVTGATGFIGGQVARRLHGEGARVLALARHEAKGKPLADLGIDVVTGDIRDYERMAQILGEGIDIVMHLAAWMRGQVKSQANAVNVDATRYLAEASAASGIRRFVYTSSIAVYGFHGDNNVDEDTPLELYGDPYGDSKILAERALIEVGRATGLPYVIVRPGMVYGPGSPGWTIRPARWAKRGQTPLIGGGRGTAYPIYIDDLVNLLLLCAVHPRAISRIYNGVSDGPVTLYEYLTGHMKMIPTNRALRLPCWMARALAIAAEPLTPTLSMRYVIHQMCGTGLILNDRAKQELGWEPGVSLEKGLRLSEDWLREEGIL